MVKRKTKGGWGVKGISYKPHETREEKRQKRMEARQEKEVRKQVSEAAKRAKRIEDLEYGVKAAGLLAKKRRLESEARQLHPLRRIISRKSILPKRKKSRKITWF